MDKIKYIFKDNNKITIKEFLKNNHIGKSKIEELSSNSLCFVNGKNVSLDTLLSNNDIIEFQICEEVDFKPEYIDIDIVYEDDFLLVVNKPNNLIIHSDNKDDLNTLSNRIAAYYMLKGISRKVRYLHRIDRDTTGLVMFAKDFLTEGIMIKKLENGEIDRYYLALVCGKWDKNNGDIIASIGTDRHINGKMCISNSAKAKYAKTGFEVIESKKEFSIVRYKLYTGRTHQIRVHSSFMGHPIVGDTMYGYKNKEKLPEHFLGLHSHIVKFKHPITKSEIYIKNSIPDIYYKLLK